MYQVFPFLAAANFALPKYCQLPMELWSLIFRFLDPASLLNVVRTHDLWKIVIKGDPVLRKKVRDELIAERQRQQEEVLNPALLISVERKGPTNLFGRNGTKTVRNKAPTVIQDTPGFLRIGDDKPKRRRNGDGGPHRSKKNIRAQPYRLLRC